MTLAGFCDGNSYKSVRRLHVAVGSLIELWHLLLEFHRRVTVGH